MLCAMLVLTATAATAEPADPPRFAFQIEAPVWLNAGDIAPGPGFFVTAQWRANIEAELVSREEAADNFKAESASLREAIERFEFRGDLRDERFDDVRSQLQSARFGRALWRGAALGAMVAVLVLLAK